MAKKKSKKPSASSSASPPEIPLLFIDRCASQRLDDALKEAGIPFVAHREKFEPACDDTVWLTVAGQEGWVVITRDKNIRRKANELLAFREARLIVFALACGNTSAADTAALVTGLYPKFLKLARSTKPPAMFSVSLGRTISPVR